MERFLLQGFKLQGFPSQGFPSQGFPLQGFPLCRGFHCRGFHCRGVHCKGFHCRCFHCTSFYCRGSIAGVPLKAFLLYGFALQGFIFRVKRQAYYVKIKGQHLFYGKIMFRSDEAPQLRNYYPTVVSLGHHLRLRKGHSLRTCTVYTQACSSQWLMAVVSHSG